MSLKNRISLSVRACLSPFGVRLVRTSKNKIRGMEPLWDLKFLSTGNPSPVIFDVGANDGETAESILEEFPSSRLFAFEPFHECFNILKGKFRNLPNVTVENLALGEEVTRKTLNVFNGNRMNSLLSLDPSPENMMRDNFHEVSKREIIVSTLDSYCQSKGVNGIDILKVDTQGYDLNVLRGAQNLFANRNIRSILLEVNFVPMYQNQPSFSDLHSYLTEKQFKLVDFYNHVRKGAYTAWCDALYTLGS